MAGDELPHGYTVADLERMAVSVAGRHSGHLMSWEERKTVARDGLLDCLYESEERPDALTLTTAAHRAINAEHHAILRNRGISNDRDITGYHAYWLYSDRCYERGFEHKVTDEHAVRWVWAQLPEWHRVPLRLLIELESYEAAARQMGLKLVTYQRHLAAARQEARALWFWPESPPKLWMRDYSGRTRTEQGRDVMYNLRMRQRARIRAHVARCPDPPHCVNCAAHLVSYGPDWWCPACRHYRLPYEDEVRAGG